ncbi:MAG TPA: Ada metal-binding domain-containing protein [Methanomassiliicoccales archaeon]|jgi:AraC family transcriptional regulator of adaptative response / methylphosphotriester-DNA alkyltransferase methyltransferase
MRRNASDPLEQQRWDAVQKGDAVFDGVFFYGVRTTGVYCRPSCRSKIPLRKNVEFFDSAEKAEERGFRPCKRCKPDLSGQDRDNSTIDQLKKVCDRYFDDRERLSAELERLDVHQNRVARQFHREYHTTPSKYINELRVSKAERLLQGSDKSMLQIASECGFGSVSSFYASYKAKYGRTPSESRTHRPRAESVDRNNR